MSNSGPKKYHWTDVQLYALGLAGQNASNQEKTTDVQLGMEIASNYKLHLQHALADMLVSWDDVHTYSMDDLVLVRTALAPVTLWNKFKDLQKKGKCLTAHYNTWSLKADFEEERLSTHAAPTLAAFLVLEARHVMEHVVEVTEDSPWHVELVVKLDGLDGAFREGRVVLEVLPIDRLGRVVPPLILHDESARILPIAGLDTPSVPPVVNFFEAWLPP